MTTSNIPAPATQAAPADATVLTVIDQDATSCCGGGGGCCGGE